MCIDLRLGPTCRWHGSMPLASAGEISKNLERRMLRSQGLSVAPQEPNFACPDTSGLEPRHPRDNSAAAQRHRCSSTCHIPASFRQPPVWT